MRDRKVDFLRFVGLSMIILAHVGPPPILFQLRNFDVPLMVMVAGISFALSYRGEPYGTYLRKRLGRLVFPVWIFLSLYFILLYYTGFPSRFPGVDKIVTSYLLLSGIGYVWIIRVFLLVALVSPLIWSVNGRIKSDARYFAMVVAIYLAYESVLAVTKPLSDTLAGQVLNSTLLYLLPYSLVFAIGVRIRSLTRRQIAQLCLSALAVFAVIGGVLYLKSGRFVPTQGFKYPPTAYYLSFALAGSAFLWLIAGWMVSAIKSIGLLRPIEFVARNSIWIYLWHIPMIEMVHQNFLITYSIVFLFAAAFTFIQVTCVETFLLPRIQDFSTRKTLRILLTG